MSILIHPRYGQYVALLFFALNTIFFMISFSLNYIWVSFNMLGYIYLNEILKLGNAVVMQLFMLILLAVLVLILHQIFKNRYLRLVILFLLILISIPILDLRGL